MNAKEVLSELKWRNDRDLDNAIIHYVHRGAPNDEKAVPGIDIQGLESSFFATSEAMIPYHRIIRIEYDGEVIFERSRR
ncbi:MAG: hypothetical protein AYK23_03555 [Candidatus Proteinoplasmatales archaeon SG8-5]|nr:MAG: hypothetical protein AYK23_03555 [Candidatus Proteinoplasmatales archaeon SG8-5]